jgi:hypothetical protein
MEDINHFKTLFVSKLNSLKTRVDNLNNYSIIEASQELRSFLFDSPCLLDILKRDKPFKVEFIINYTRFMDEPEGTISSFLWKEICPNGIDPQRSFSKEDFLHYDCIHYNQKKFTILQLIKFYAFVKGGIHIKPKEKPEYEDLKSAFDLIKINGQISTLDHTMRGIIQATHETLEFYKERLLYS